MLVGSGIDIIEIARIQKAMQKPKFTERIFNKNEIVYCKGRGTQAYASFAARFAAKEAVLKAFGTGLRDGKLTDIEIYNDELGCPKVRLHGYFKELYAKKNIADICISLSHSREYAVAQAICWRNQ